MLGRKGPTSECWHCSGLDHLSFACPPLRCDFILFSSSLNTSHVLMLRSWSSWGLSPKLQVCISAAGLIPALIFLIAILHLACPQTKHPLFPYEPANENTILPVARAKKQNKIKHKQTPLVLTHPLQCCWLSLQIINDISRFDEQSGSFSFFNIPSSK